MNRLWHIKADGDNNPRCEFSTLIRILFIAIALRAMRIR